jgi:DNA-binding MarR family transcriptional regulator
LTNQAEAEREAALIDALDGRLFARVLIPCATALRRLATAANTAKYDLAHRDWTILALVGGQAEIGFKDLSELIALDAGQLSRGLTALEQKGLVHRENLRTFPREQKVSLTPAGAELFRRMREAASARNRRLLEDVDLADLKRLAALLDVVRERAVDLLREQRLENA